MQGSSGSQIRVRRPIPRGLWKILKMLGKGLLQQRIASHRQFSPQPFQVLLSQTTWNRSLKKRNWKCQEKYSHKFSWEKRYALLTWGTAAFLHWERITGPRVSTAYFKKATQNGSVPEVPATVFLYQRQVMKSKTVHLKDCLALSNLMEGSPSSSAFQIKQRGTQIVTELGGKSKLSMSLKLNQAKMNQRQST